MSQVLSSVGVLISYAVIFTVAYLPVVQTHFFYRDEYVWILPNVSQSHLNRVLMLSMGDGRFLDGYTHVKVFNYIHHLQSTGSDFPIRFIGIISIVLLAYVLFVIFKTNGIKTEYAFAASILICTLPGFQVYVSWIVLNPDLSSATLSAISGLILFKVLFNENKLSILRRRAAIFMAALIFIISLNFYQPSAQFYWSVGVIPLALLRDEDLTGKWRAPFITYFSVGFVSMVVYYLSIKAVNFAMSINMQARGNLIEFTVNAIKGKVYWLFLSERSPLLNSLNLWNITPTKILAGVVGVIITLGLLLSLRQAISEAIKERKFTLIWNHSQRMLLIIITIPLSFIATIVLQESWATYRTIVSLEATICILFFISMLKIGEFLKSEMKIIGAVRKIIIPVVVIVLSVFVVYEANSNVDKYFAGLQSSELEYIKRVIKKHGISHLSENTKIYVREPKKKFYIDNRFRFEFGIPSTNDGYSEDIVNVALYELGVKDKIDVDILRPHEPIPTGSDILVIDLNKLNRMLHERFNS